MNSKAIILLSGGIDSATCLAMAKAQQFACYTLSFDYGQKHQKELKAAKKLAEAFDVIEHRQFTLPIGQLGGSALTDQTIAVPDYDNSKVIPQTYVPARNTIFLSIALAWAEVLSCTDIFFGANLSDYSGYPDCRPEYFQAFENLAHLATQIGTEQNKKIKIHTPLLYFNKKQIIKLAVNFGVDLSLTVSCYRATENMTACGTCSSCELRAQGFREANLIDT